MSRRVNLTVDCTAPAALVPFWKLALGYEDDAAPAPFETRDEWLAGLGVPPSERADGVWLYDPAGMGPPLSFQHVPEPKVAKNRLHLDVHVGDAGTAEARWPQIAALAEALLAAGGAVLAEHPGHHIVMADPEGNELCLC
jgi:hypothetical protein